MTPDSGTRRYPAEKYDYVRIFDPDVDLNSPDEATARAGGDRPRNSPYHYDEDIILAVNAALAANRPLLVAGPAGVGKSALAANIADQMRWGYEAKVITGQTEGRDLLWRYDTVRRLRDAYLVAAGAGQPRAPDSDESPDLAPVAQHDPRNVLRYIERGVLWKAFDRSRRGERVVVLIDEIDKADPDVPNSLLEVLGNGRFTFEETGDVVRVDDEHPPFIVITTNDERELSRPFRRRCVTLALSPPNEDRLNEIAGSWNLDQGAGAELAPALAKEVAELGDVHTARGPLESNVAEYLDALRVCLDLNVKLPSPEWDAVKRLTLLKELAPREDEE